MLVSYITTWPSANVTNDTSNNDTHHDKAIKLSQIVDNVSNNALIDLLDHQTNNRVKPTEEEASEEPYTVDLY